MLLVLKLIYERDSNLSKLNDLIAYLVILLSKNNVSIRPKKFT